ncbi:MAG: biopolymer transporter ExbD [Bacteroidia bacterium]|jgi:biopolymer transport protein ExbD|nr:biopolymer transporter ExbD [Bacteroidia bacterium]
MAEVNTGGGGGGKHQKKGRKSSGTPRVDMTPMVDLAFLLLTFFVLTSQLNKPKASELIVPKPLEKNDTNTTKIPDELAVTILLDGNKGKKIYYYEGKLPTESGKILDITMDPKKGLRRYILERNRKVIAAMNDLRNQFQAGKIDSLAYDTLPRTKKYKNQDDAPFFIVKWGGDATYGDVIDVIDELKIGDVSRYALTKISQPEYEVLSVRTGIKYKDMLPPGTNQ